MGAYLSNPITEKHSYDDRNDRLKCGASSMQGWRVSQEDAHNCILNLTENTSLFAVYDGHGGKEVAEYAADKLSNFIMETESFKRGDYAEALKEAFISFDKSLTEPAVIAVLKTIADKPEGEVTTDDEDENIGDLREEASMPLDQLIARYRKGRLTEANDAPASPFLRAKATNLNEEGSSKSIDTDYTDGGAVSSSSVVAASSSSGSGQPSVSSSPKKERPRKSLEEKYANGDVKKVESEEADSTGDVVSNGEGENKDDGVDEVSSSVGNGPMEGVEEGKRKGKALVKASPVKKKQVVSDEDLFKKFVSTGAVEDSSDSDDNFPEVGSSSDEADPEDVEEGEDEEEDEEEEEEEDDDDEGEESDEVDDDEFTMKMTDELMEALKGGRPLSERDQPNHEDDDESGDTTGFGRRFLIDALTRKEPGSDSGCTAVVALVLPDRVLVANAGDSRCVACRGGVAVDLSVDHKPEDVEELARITKAGGKVTNDGRVNGGLNLSRALGDHVYKQVAELPLQEQMISSMPDIKDIELTDDVEFLVLACDGIWNFMSSQEVVDFVRPRLQKKPSKLSDICEELFDHCLAPNTLGDGTGCDNMTAVIVQIRPGPEEAVESTSEDTNKNTSEDVRAPKRRSDADVDADAGAKKSKTEDPDFSTTAP